jgi:hypothetical protein
MWKRSPVARASDRSEGGIDRRRFLGGAAMLLLWPTRGFAQPTPAPAATALPAATLQLLEASKFAYLSPLRKDGAESTCHGEVWFAWLDGSVLVNSRRGTWKVQALEKGLDRARIWVGDHGRWKSAIVGERSEAFRVAPHFDAHASFESDRAVNDRLIALYEKKYAGDFDRWREDMKTGFYSGERKLIRYTPVT